MKLKTLLIVPLSIVCLAYIGAKGYIYYKTKSGLDKLIRTAAPVVQIDYSDIGSDLSGVIYINNVRITPTGAYDELTIDQLSVSGNGLKFLLDMMRGFDSNEPPPQITIAFKKLESPVSSSFLSNFTSSFKTDEAKRKIKACSIPGILNAVGLNELNLSTITVNGKLGYIFDKEANQAEFNLKYDLVGIESTLLDIRVSQLSSQGLMGIGKLPIVEQFHMVRQFKEEYIKQIVNHCATEASLATTSFIDDLFTQSDDYYLKTLGFVPGPGLSDLFRQLITNAGTVEITATPSSEISPALLKAYRPEDLTDLFGVTASYNGAPIQDLSFSMQSSAPKSNSITTERTVNTTKPTTVTAMDKIIQPKPKQRLRYLDTDISELQNYMYYKIRAYTLNNDKPKQGMLISITNNTVNIEHLVFSGKITSHIHIDRIDRIEVLRREKPNEY